MVLNNILVREEVQVVRARARVCVRVHVCERERKRADCMCVSSLCSLSVVVYFHETGEGNEGVLDGPERSILS